MIVFKDKPDNLGDPIKVTKRTGMGRGIVRPIQSLNEKAVYNIGFSPVYFYFFSTLLL